MIGKILYSLDRFYKTKLPIQTVGVKAMLFTPDNKIVLIKHSYIPGWHFPGGRIDPHESAQKAAARESKEEAGAIVDPASFSLHGVYSNFGLRRNDHVVVLVGKNIEINEQLRKKNFEIIDVGCFSLEALPSDISLATQNRLNEFISGKALLLGNWETAG